MSPFFDINDESALERKFVKESIIEDYRFHEMSDGSFLVFKDIAEEPSYEINPEHGCSCPAATYRQNSCKHEKMVGYGRAKESEIGDSGKLDLVAEPESANDLLNLLD